jgi:hypothetical protein
MLLRYNTQHYNFNAYMLDDGDDTPGIIPKPKPVMPPPGKEY